MPGGLLFCPVSVCLRSGQGVLHNFSVEDPLQRFREVMLVSAITSTILFALLLLLTAGRSTWRRLLNIEESFWRRLRINERWLQKARNIEDNRFLVPAVVVLLLLHLALFGFSAAAYAHFAKQIKGRQRVVLPIPTRQPSQGTNTHNAGAPKLTPNSRR